MADKEEIAEFAAFANYLIKRWTRAQLYREVYASTHIATSDIPISEAAAAQALVSFDGAFREPS